MATIRSIELGQKVKDKVTGFTGIATARVEYLNGCVQFCVTPTMAKDGKFPEHQYIDRGQLEFVDSGVSIPARNTGGPQSNPPPRDYR